jgi:PEP-CTERM motif
LQTTPVRTIVNTNGTLTFDSNTTVVSNQLVAPTQTVNTVLAERFDSSGDGSRVIYRGQLNGPTATRDFVAVDNSVVAQIGAPLPGGVIPGVNVTAISADFSSQQFNHTGTVWTARVSLSDTTDVVLRNGAVLARTDTPIFTGSSLNWDDAAFAANFFLSASNGQGDVVVGGLVNSGDVNADAYLVFLGNSGTNFVLARENDPVDLNNNGLFDDNAFIDTFGNDDGVLADNGTYYFVATLRDGVGTDIGHAFMFIAPSAVPEPGTIALLGLAGAGGVYWYRRRQSQLAMKLGSKLKTR